MKRTTAIGLMIFAIVLMASCQPPSPLYGTWSDNNSNRITFANDGTYSSMIEDTSYDGNYTVIENVISFSAEDGTRVTEWDLRGSILYLQWVGKDKNTVNLALYRN